MAGLKKVASGAPLRISASDFNSFVDAALLAKSRGRQGAVPGMGIAPGAIMVRNTTGGDLSRNAVVGLGNAVISAADNLRQFREPMIALDGVLPNAEIHDWAFAILTEPIANGAIGRAIHVGLAAVQVDVSDEDHDRAQLITGDTAKLESSDSGPFAILYKEPGMGLKWAWGHIGGAAAANAENLRMLGEVWLKNSDGEFAVQIPAEPLFDPETGLWHGTSISYEFDSDSGLTGELTRNQYPDPDIIPSDPPDPEDPAASINSDDIEIKIRIREGGVQTAMIADGAVTDAKIDSVGWSKVTGAPTGVADHGFDSATHTGIDVSAKAQDHVLFWDAVTSVWLTAVGILRRTGRYVVDGFMEIFNESLILSGGTPDAPGAMDTGDGIGFRYSATRAVAWRKNANAVAMADGTVGGAFDDIINYNYSATVGDRSLNVLTQLSLVQSSLTLAGGSVASPAAASANQGYRVLYSATRYTGWAYVSSKLVLQDGTSASGPDGTAPIEYTPSSVDIARRLNIDVRVSLKGTAGTVGQIIEVDSGGKLQFVQPLGVCYLGRLVITGGTATYYLTTSPQWSRFGPTTSENWTPGVAGTYLFKVHIVQDIDNSASESASISWGYRKNSEAYITTTSAQAARSVFNQSSFSPYEVSFLANSISIHDNIVLTLTSSDSVTFRTSWAGGGRQIATLEVIKLS